MFLIFTLLAAGNDDVDEARKHYEAGRALYSVDRFNDAAVEFEAGFALAPKPLFLFNAAQSLKRLAEVTHDRATMLRAQARYLEYLRIAPAQDPEREQSQAKLNGIAQWLKDNPGDAPVVAPPPVFVEPAMPAEKVVEPAPVEPLPQAETRKSGFFAEHPWVIAVIGGVVVAAGVSVGAYFAVEHSQNACASASIGCLDARH